MGGITIWYLLECHGREEAEVLDVCRECLPDTVVKDVFVLTYDCMRRYERAWHMERRLLFPSYVFLESENKEFLSEELRKCMVAAGQKRHMLQLDREETDFLKKLCGENHHLKMSRGVIRKGSAQIMEGPLKGAENRICRIDRHKRLARVKVMMKPDWHLIPAGLEITEKSD